MWRLGEAFCRISGAARLFLAYEADVKFVGKTRKVQAEGERIQSALIPSCNLVDWYLLLGWQNPCSGSSCVFVSL